MPFSPLSIACCWVLLLLGSCGYSWKGGDVPTIAIPFAQHDEDGSFTAHMIAAISQSGKARIGSADADFRLVLSIENSSNEIIGFRKDQQQVDGKVNRNMVACEGRKTIAAQVSLFKGSDCVLGPLTLTADGDYDYVDGDSVQDLAFFLPDGTRQIVLPFSLGQLEAVDAAQEAVTRPIYRQLAQKIVDAISAEW